MDFRGRQSKYACLGEPGQMGRRTMRPGRLPWEKNVRGILESMTSRREFLSDSSHRIRFVYLPKHSSWLNQIEIFFGIVHRKCLRGGDFTSVADLESRLRQFILYYNTTMAHPFDWTYTGKPLQKTRRPRFVPPHRRVKMRGPNKSESFAV